MNIRTLAEIQGGGAGGVQNNGPRGFQPFQGRGQRLGGRGGGVGNGGRGVAGRGGGIAPAAGFQVGFVVGNVIGEMIAPDVAGAEVAAAEGAVANAVQAAAAPVLLDNNRRPPIPARQQGNDNNIERNAQFANEGSARSAALREARVDNESRPCAFHDPATYQNTGIVYQQDRQPLGRVEIYQSQVQFVTNLGGQWQNTQYIALQYHSDGHAYEGRPHLHIRPAIRLSDGTFIVDDNGYLYNDMGDIVPIRWHFYFG
jgi:hypothetical protein